MGGFLHALAADLPERLADNAGPAPGKVTLTMRLPPAAEEAAIGPLLAKLDPAISTPASSAYADPFGLHLETGRPAPAAGGGGHALGPLAATFERAFGADLSAVRVHHDDLAAQHGALAVTHGDDIHFAPGAFRPDDEPGRELIGHELTHVLQQRAGRVAQPQHKGGLVIDAGLEREADELGARAARGEEVRVDGSGGVAGKAAQPKLAVAVETGPDAGEGPIIQNVRVAGRPEGPTFGGRQGDHTTAWGVMVLAVVNRLRGRTARAAVGELRDLFHEAMLMPGAAEARQAAMPDERRAALAEARAALEDADTVLDVAGRGGVVDQMTQALQRGATAYLAFRNVMGLTVYDSGAAATGDGEAGRLQLLQYWEEQLAQGAEPTDDDRPAITAAMGGLFSPVVAAAVGPGGAGASPAQLPGLRPEDAPDVGGLLRDQHLRSLDSAFPRLYAWIGGASRDAMVLGNSAATPRPADAGATQVAGHAVQISLAGERIGSVEIAGRPPRGTAGGAEGDHTTAHLIAEESVRQALAGRTLAEAVAGLDALRAAFQALPGAQADRAGRQNRQRLDHLVAATAELAAAHGAARDGATVSAVQRYAVALLYYRNSLALSVVAAGGGVSVGHGEAASRDALLALEATLAAGGAVDGNELQTVVGRLFEPSAFAAYQRAHDLIQDDGEVEEAIDAAPGFLADDDDVTVFAAALEQHLRSLAIIAPHVVGAISEELAHVLITGLTRGLSPAFEGPVLAAMASAVAAGVPPAEGQITARAKAARKGARTASRGPRKSSKRGGSDEEYEPYG